MRDEIRESLALLPSRSEPWIWISKPTEGRIKKFISGRSASTGALSVERPAKNELGGAILLSRHPSEPMVDERGLSNTRPGNDCNDIDILVCPWFGTGLSVSSVEDPPDATPPPSPFRSKQTRQNSIAPENSLPQLGQVRWGWALIFL